MSCSSVNSVERWDMLMNFFGQNDSVLCPVPKGISILLTLLRRELTTTVTKPENMSSLPVFKTRYCNIQGD